MTAYSYTRDCSIRVTVVLEYIKSAYQGVLYNAATPEVVSCFTVLLILFHRSDVKTAFWVACTTIGSFISNSTYNINWCSL